MSVAVIVLIVVVGLIGAFVLTRVVANRTAARSAEQVAAGAEAEVEILDGDWGVAPPSEPEQPAQRPQAD